jgi:hypothetical protein
VQNPEPDLNAIARRLEAQKSMRPESWDAWCLHAVSDVASLLAHVRALEAALQPFADLLPGSLDNVGAGTLVSPSIKVQLIKDARAALDPNRSE